MALGLICQLAAGFPAQEWYQSSSVLLPTGASAISCEPSFMGLALNQQVGHCVGPVWDGIHMLGSSGYRSCVSAAC